MNASIIRLHAINGLESGVELQRIGPSGVGFQNSLDLGFVYAANASCRVSMAPDVTHTGDGHPCAFAIPAGTFVQVKRAIVS